MCSVRFPRNGYAEVCDPRRRGGKGGQVARNSSTYMNMSHQLLVVLALSFPRTTPGFAAPSLAQTEAESRQLLGCFQGQPPFDAGEHQYLEMAGLNTPRTYFRRSTPPIEQVCRV